MKRASALSAVLGVFLVGALAGGLGVHLYYADAAGTEASDDLQRPRLGGRGPGGGFGGGRGPGMAGRFVERLEDQLGLTPEQKDEIDRILQESHAESQAVREEIRPRLEEQMRRTRERIEDVLTVEQLERFAELRRAHRGRAERFFMGRGGRFRPPPPPPID